MTPLRVCLAGTWDRGFGRNRIVRHLLEVGGHRVDVCQVDLWGRREDAIVRGGKLRTVVRAVLAYPRLAWRFLRAPRPDVVFVPYPGHFDLPLLALLARWRGLPVVFDPFISLYDTIVSDRELASPRSLVGRLMRGADRLACRLADLVLADTPEHAAYLAELSGVPEDRFRVLWVGTEERLFHPRPEIRPDPTRVLFYGTYIPLHGLETIVRAAVALEGDGVTVHVIGDGQEQPRIDRLVAELAPGNLERTGRVPLERLPEEIARAGLCLGIFGTTAKAGRVVPNKVFQCLAVGRPVVTAATPAIGGAFAPGEVVAVPAGDPVALAAALRRLVLDTEERERTAARGLARFRRDYGEEALARLLTAHLEAAVALRSPTPGAPGPAPGAGRGSPRPPPVA